MGGFFWFLFLGQGGLLYFIFWHSYPIRKSILFSRESSKDEFEKSWGKDTAERAGGIGGKIRLLKHRKTRVKPAQRGPFPHSPSPFRSAIFIFAVEEQEEHEAKEEQKTKEKEEEHTTQETQEV